MPHIFYRTTTNQSRLTGQRGIISVALLAHITEEGEVSCDQVRELAVPEQSFCTELDLLPISGSYNLLYSR